MNEATEWALKFARVGQSVFPLYGVKEVNGNLIDLKTGAPASRADGSGKTPMVHWPSWATRDPEKIQDWAERNPDCNWGVKLDGIFVIDCDSDDAIDRFQTVWDSEYFDSDERMSLDDTFTVATARGCHIYFEGDSRTKKVAADMDLKGRGGYVVLPGSRSYDGSVYRATGPFKFLRDPGWVGSYERDRPVTHEGEPLRLGEGERNSGLAKIMGHMRALGLPDATMIETLRVINQHVCDPPLRDSELAETIERSMVSWAPGSAVEDAIIVERLFGQDESPDHRFLMFKKDREMKPPPRWLLDGLLPETGIAQLYGASYTGKTFVAIDLALHVANQRDWCGFPLIQATAPSDYGTDDPKDHVLYILGEGSFDFQERIKAWCTVNAGTDESLITVEEMPLDLSSIDGWKGLVREIAQDTRAMDVRHRLALIVIDTQSLLLSTAEENSNTEMNRAMRAAKAMSRLFKCPVLFVHHSGSSGASRGATAVGAAMDCKMKLEGSGRDGVRSLKVEKVKAGQIPGEDIPFAIVRQGISAVATANPSLALMGASTHPHVEQIEAFMQEHGPQPFIELVRLVRIADTNTRARTLLRDRMLSSGKFEETSQLVNRSPVWMLATTS